MEALEVVKLSMEDHQATFVKGKRTKRITPHSPDCSTYSASEVDDNVNYDVNDIEDDEDIANCLILLAQGQSRPVDEFTRKLGYYAYECKTCGRSFSSFQALGGHRSSHKKPKIMAAAFSSKNNFDSSIAPQLGHRAVKNVHQCSVCGVEFSSGQALGGHMRRHRAAAAAAAAASFKLESHEHKKPTRLLSFDLDLNLLPLQDEDEDDPDGSGGL